jgi:adenosine deaminase
MSIESFIQAMPKVELNLQFEGALNREALLLIAEQNDVAASIKHFNQWVQLLDRPDYQRLDEMLQVICKWLVQPEDLTRLVYEMGVGLAKQQVRYAEVTINPFAFIDNGMTFEQFLNAINDGRSRVERGWGVKLVWVLGTPRDQPRRADDVVRWASSTTAKKGGVVGVGLVGRDDSQPAGQFERVFKTAHKKDIPRLAHAGDRQHAEGILDVIHNLAPNRIVGGWGSADAPDVLALMREQQITLDVSLAGALCMGWVGSYADYPLRHLYDEAVRVAVGSGMPALFKTGLTQEYLAVVEHCGFSVGELCEVALNAVRSSFLDESDKQTMLEAFNTDYARLQVEHAVTTDTAAR